jgi:DNA-binding response OmpR family regulator
MAVGDSTGTVLVVDDDDTIRRSLERGLRLSGFTVRSADGGRAALELVATEPPDVLVLDVSMPDLTGTEVCRRLRDQGVDTPVLMLSALDELADRVAGLQAGADDYLVKPFAIEELLARLRAHLRRGNLLADRLQAADLVLQPTARVVTRAGRDIQLTAQEFSLLELLMRHPNQVLTRQRILDHVWGYNAMPSSNVVDLYIHYLRDKIDRGESRKLIQTVRSVGYVLRP